MKKQIMKNLVGQWNKTITKEYTIDRDAYTESLRELNVKYGDGNRYCSSSKNVAGLVGTDYEDRAFELYRRISELDGKRKALSKFLEITKNFDL